MQVGMQIHEVASTDKNEGTKNCMDKKKLPTKKYMNKKIVGTKN